MNQSVVSTLLIVVLVLEGISLLALLIANRLRRLDERAGAAVGNDESVAANLLAQRDVLRADGVALRLERLDLRLQSIDLSLKVLVRHFEPAIGAFLLAQMAPEASEKGKAAVDFVQDHSQTVAGKREGGKG